MGIKVILDGVDAEKYLQDQDQNKAALANSLQTAMEYIEVLEKAAKVEEAPINGVSSKVLRDTEAMNELTGQEIMKTSNNKRWSPSDVSNIISRFDLEPGTVRKTVDALLESIAPGRTKDALVTKIYDLGGRVEDGEIFLRED